MSGGCEVMYYAKGQEIDVTPEFYTNLKALNVVEDGKKEEAKAAPVVVPEPVQDEVPTKESLDAMAYHEIRKQFKIESEHSMKKPELIDAVLEKYGE